jgi:hypothetical protein
MRAILSASLARKTSQRDTEQNKVQTTWKRTRQSVDHSGPVRIVVASLES